MSFLYSRNENDSNKIGRELISMVTDRRAGKRNVPHVGKQPRARTQSGTWRRKKDLDTLKDYLAKRPLRLDEISYFLNPLITDKKGLTVIIGPIVQ
ncbi:MAG: hypothetical protein BV457_07220 [Thermoplasmata archaeon M9B1D]|nr:MAG: hypothetical protein BV457_07220 [Thermoplasmata archaeon M9B1D]